MYRSPEGLKCAVGCLIPDDLYQKEMDKGGGGSTHIAFILRKYPELPDWMRRHQDLLGELQFVHDDDSSWNYRSGFSDYGHNTMKRLAARHDLKFVSLEH